MLFKGGFNFSNFLIELVTIFAFVVWFWLIVTTIFADLFRRTDISGWAKAIWVIVLILTPYIGVIIYVITQARGMDERKAQQARAAREELRRVVGFSVADEIGKLDQNLRVFARGWCNSVSVCLGGSPTFGLVFAQSKRKLRQSSSDNSRCRRTQMKDS